MRGRIALQSNACEIVQSALSVSRSFGMRTRPRVAFSLRVQFDSLAALSS